MLERERERDKEDWFNCKKDMLEREREGGGRDLKKIFLRICYKVFFGQRQIEIYLYCSGRYKPFNITNCSFTPAFGSSEDDAFLIITLTKNVIE